MSGDRGVVALRIAQEAELILMPVAQAGVVRECGPILEVGPNASPDRIVTIACRRMLARDGAAPAAVADLVARYGYEYSDEANVRAAVL
jgi:hypothetical protein